VMIHVRCHNKQEVNDINYSMGNLTTAELISLVSDMRDKEEAHAQMLNGAGGIAKDSVLELLEKFRKTKSDAIGELARRDVIV
jgi:hypothetical protein